MVQRISYDFLTEALPKRDENGHKGTFGKVLVVGGSIGYTGAPYLAAEAAIRSGCGLVFLGVPESIWQVEACKCVSAMPFPLAAQDGMFHKKALPEILEKLSGCDVLALGPGLGRSRHVTQVVTELMKTEKPIVLDADGLNAVSEHIDALDARRGRVTILTPHEGEFVRLGRDRTHSREDAARSFAAQHGCVLVLKGPHTLIATPEGNVLENTSGNSGLAKGGSGDILTGVIASLLAQGATPVRAAALGVWLHGRAGDYGAERKSAYALTPEDVLEELSAAFMELKEIGRME